MKSLFVALLFLRLFENFVEHHQHGCQKFWFLSFTCNVNINVKYWCRANCVNWLIVRGLAIWTHWVRFCWLLNSNWTNCTRTKYKNWTKWRKFRRWLWTQNTKVLYIFRRFDSSSFRDSSLFAILKSQTVHFKGVVLTINRRKT